MKRRKRRSWTREEDSIIHTMYKFMSDRELADILGRAKKSTTARRVLLGLTKRVIAPKMNDEVKTYIIRNGPYSSNYKLAKILNRSETSVRDFRIKEGIPYKLAS